ncbi:MAG: hypothetical protein M1833_004832 [Piccolia ochrophora]|nr:MAG: hypothetical protein M1833_004832 [Piccolia ochrophora]
MSLLSIYRDFLRSPSLASLADDVSLHYITSLTSLKGSENVVRQLSSKALRKHEEKIIDAIEGEEAVSLIVQTTMEFLTSGGAYMPGLDDNFLTDRTVTLPIAHIVYFDSDRRIVQIRLQWDQGSLLKDVEVIGARGRGWPIRDGKDQARLITSSAATSSKILGHGDPRKGDPAITTNRGNALNRESPQRNPRAGDSSSAAKESVHQTPSTSSQGGPRASAKPPPRDLRDLFVGNESDQSPTTVSKGRSFAGGKSSLVEPAPPKKGSGKNYAPSRLFDRDDTPPTASPQKGVDSPSKKYNHFEFADGSDELDKPKPAPVKPKTSKHASQWDFEDFVTPQKPTQKTRGQDVRHFGWGDDDVNQESPVKQKTNVQPRRDAETHFEFVDDGTPDGERRPSAHPRGASHNTGLGLYQNNIYDDHESGQSADDTKTAQPLDQANTNAHRKVFDSQFSMVDDSPEVKNKTADRPVTADRKAAVRMMDSNWDSYNESPDASHKGHEKGKENVRGDRAHQGIKTSGDGMGGRSGSARQWGFGDESDPEESKPAVAQKKQGSTQGKSFWDF